MTKDLIRTTTSLMIGGALGFLLAYTFYMLVTAYRAEATYNQKVTICHATGSQNNPYQKLEVDTSSIDGQGNGDHNRSTHQNGKDIIPSGWWDWNGRNWDTEGKAIWNNNCNIPRPTPTNTPTPTPTNTPIPTTLTPTPTPEDECKECQEVTPTPTPTPVYHEPDPWDCSKDHSCKQFPEPPVCRDGNVLQLPANFHVKRKDAFAILQWFPTGGSEVNVFWKENGATDWQHGLADIPNSGYRGIGDLDPNKGYTFGLMQKNGCAGGEMVTAIVIDPPAKNWTLFRFNFWQWH